MDATATSGILPPMGALLPYMDGMSPQQQLMSSFSPTLINVQPSSMDRTRYLSPAFFENLAAKLSEVSLMENNSNSDTWADPYKVFISSLHDDIQDEDLRDYFSRFGQVQKADVIRCQYTGKSRGFGFVKFCDATARDMALGFGKYQLIKSYRCCVDVKKGKRSPTHSSHSPSPLSTSFNSNTFHSTSPVYSNNNYANNNSQYNSGATAVIGMCRQCCKSRAEMVFYPCGHVYFCERCVAGFNFAAQWCCPLCRKTINDVIRLQWQ